MRAKFFTGLLSLICLTFVLSDCTTARPSHRAFRPEKLAEMDAAINTAIAGNKCPGGVLWLEHNGTAYHRAFGHRALVPAREAMTENTIFDAASLTKVVATTPTIMLLIERGKINLEAPVQTYLPEFTGDGKELVTVRELLTHTSGLPPDNETKTDWHGQTAAIQKACAEKLQSPPGSAFKYSDINFFLLGEIVQRVSRTPPEAFAQCADGSGGREALARRGSRPDGAQNGRRGRPCGLVHDGVRSGALLADAAESGRTGRRADFQNRNGQADDERPNAAGNFGEARTGLGH